VFFDILILLLYVCMRKHIYINNVMYVLLMLLGGITMLELFQFTEFESEVAHFCMTSFLVCAALFFIVLIFAMVLGLIRAIMDIHKG